MNKNNRTDYFVIVENKTGMPSGLNMPKFETTTAIYPSDVTSFFGNKDNIDKYNLYTSLKELKGYDSFGRAQEVQETMDDDLRDGAYEEVSSEVRSEKGRAEEYLGMLKSADVATREELERVIEDCEDNYIMNTASDYVAENFETYIVEVDRKEGMVKKITEQHTKA